MSQTALQHQMELSTDLLQHVEGILQELEEEQETAFGRIPAFGHLLLHLGHRMPGSDPDSLAMSAAFALVRVASAWPPPDLPSTVCTPHSWPPPSDLVSAARKQWECRNHHRQDDIPSQRRERALEFVVAFLLGWHRRPVFVGAPAIPASPEWTDGHLCLAGGCPGEHQILVDPQAPQNDWRGVAQGARNLLLGQDQVACLVGVYFRILSQQADGIPGVPHLSTEHWLFHALNRFGWVGGQRGCDCCDKYVAATGARWDELCQQEPQCRDWHDVRRWNPRTHTLWDFVRHAVLGFEHNPEDLRMSNDPVARVRAEQFVRALLHAALWAGQPSHAPVWLVHHRHLFRQCDQCGETISLQCHWPHFDAGADSVRPAFWLLRNKTGRFDAPPTQATPDPALGYQWIQARACRNGHGRVGQSHPQNCLVCGQALVPIEAYVIAPQGVQAS